ncbi:MAG: hypothetical protein ACE5GR_01815 [Nitrosopumilus sp.]
MSVLAALVFGSIGMTNVFAEDTIVDLIPENVSTAKTDAFLDVSDVSADRQSEVHFNGATDGWAIITGQAYDSKIGLDGNAVHQGNGVWKIKSLADISVEDRNTTLELKGKAVNGKLRLHGTGTLDDGDSFRIILRGHYAPIHDQPGDFIVDWSMAKIQNMENGFRIPLSQNGIVHVEPVIPTVDISDLETDLNTEE